MKFKKIWISALLFCKIVCTEQVYKTTWLSGVDCLDKVECLKYDKLCSELNGLCKDVFDAKFYEKMKPCLDKWSKAYEKLGLAVEKAEKKSKKSKKQSVSIAKKIEQDKNLTVLVKNLAEIFDTYFNDCIDINDSAHQHLLNVLSQYLPETVDLNQVHLDYLLWGYEYLQTRLDKKGCLKIEDAAYVVQQFMYYVKQQISYSTMISLKKSYYMWTGLVDALEKGMKEQPKDVQKYFLDNLEAVIKDSDLKSCFDTIKLMDQLRKDIIKSTSKGKAVDKIKLKEYEQLLDQVIDRIGKVVVRHVGKKNPEPKFFTMTEKLLFNS